MPKLNIILAIILSLLIVGACVATAVSWKSDQEFKDRIEQFDKTP